MGNPIRGPILMVLAMLGFAIEDMFVKKLTVGLPVGQVPVRCEGVDGCMAWKS